MFNSDAKQDQFVANILNFKRDGCFIDIGACGAIGSNNTCFFETLNWGGICIEIENRYSESYKNRKCHFVNQDALKIDYKKMFEEFRVTKTIDYLSIDIDTLSYDALLKLPFDDYIFKVITIEHDGYLYGDEYRIKQRDFLNNKGYHLLCEDVYVEQAGYYGKQLPFEDWWVKKDFFEEDLLKKIQSSNCLPSQIIAKF